MTFEPRGRRPAGARWRPTGALRRKWSCEMGLISLVWGVFAMIWMVVALIPLLGWGNWFLIPFAAVGAVIAAIGILFTRTEKRGRAWTGLVLNGIVIVVGIVRLGLGGGVI